jgi:hypothetical protein
MKQRQDRFEEACELIRGLFRAEDADIIDRIGEFGEAGVAEIMFGGIPLGDLERLSQFETEILPAFLTSRR